VKFKPPKSWFAFAVLAGALLLWAALFALGAYLQIGADQPRHDVRKPLIILTVMAVFVSSWGLALWLRTSCRDVGKKTDDAAK
jgi:hypothetical protein